MPAADAQQLRALVSSVAPSSGRRHAVAVRADPSWTGPAVLDGPTPIRVVACPSPLAVRAALVDHSLPDGAREAGGEVLALLTSCSDGELGPDVLARLVKRRVLQLDPFSAVLALFGGTVLDPTLVRDERWLLDDLIALAPAGGWPSERPPNGVVDLDRAWKVWHAARFRGVARPETLAEVLIAGDDPTVASEVAGLGDERRSNLARYWASGAAPVDVLLDLIAAGRGGELTALGMVAEVLWTPTDDAALAQAQTLGRARLENVLGRDRLTSASARAWASAATEVTTSAVSPLAHLDRAGAILGNEAGVGELAVLSDWLPRGFELRLQRLADALTSRDIDAAEMALAAVCDHRSAADRSARISTAEAAVRLLRRSVTASGGRDIAAGSELPELVSGYASDGAWVDEARRALTEGEQAGELSAAYERLLAEANTERRTADLAFAESLRDWSKSEPVEHEALLPLEHVLDQVVAPIAAAGTPVLILVCDGMGLPVAHELLRDLAGVGWMPAAPTDRAAWPTGVAMLPTITEVSRASLFAGARVEGDRNAEITSFQSHPALRAASSPTLPPVLFHKGQLTAGSGRAIPEPVRQALANPAQKVVGIVVNAVDDHLSKGQQVRVGWGLGSLRPLEWLLDAAQEAGRVVLLTADHGHVLHPEGAVSRPTTPGSESGERWRLAPPTPADDEVEVSGPRVLKGGRVILPADDRVRYGGYGHGYHGGATPQEVLVPIVALARTLPDGWTHRPLTPPTWWTGEPDPEVAPSTAAAPPVARRQKPPSPTPPQPSLFEPEPPPPAPEPTAPSGTDASTGWVADLLDSPTYQAHAQQVRLPRPLAPERVAGYLTAIHANGGSIPLPALATRVGEPADQLRMALTMVQRLVNLDGAEILALRANATVELNTDLLAVQFDIVVDGG